MTEVIIQSLSLRRFETYLKAAGHNTERALRLYLWNARLGAAFHLPIQAVEVSLRNRINTVLVAEFGPNWWQEAQFLGLADHDRKRDLDTVKSRTSRRGAELDTDQVVASLSFGFWAGMLHRRYNPQIWGRHLASGFPDLPADIDRDKLHQAVIKVARLRNRISHHEPLIKTNVMQHLQETMTLLRWLCPSTAAWIRPHCDVPKVIREKP